MQHRRAPYLTVAAVTAAFVVGGATAPATAGAARLTKSKVEKIAAKVVDGKAPTLKVSYAATAGSATTAASATRAVSAGKADDSSALGGKAASDYLTQVRTFDLGSAQPARAASISWTFTGLSAGDYLLAYDVVLDKSSATSAVTCSLGYADIGRPIPEQDRSQSTTETVVGSVLVTYDGIHAPQLGCAAASGTITTRPAQSYGSSATLTRVDAVVPGTATTP